MPDIGYLVFRPALQEAGGLAPLITEIMALSQQPVTVYKVDPAFFMGEETLPLLETPNNVHIRGISEIEKYVEGLRQSASSH